MSQKTFDQQVFAKPSDLSDMAEELQLVWMKDNVDAGDYQKFIDLSKNRILKFDLKKHLRTIYSDTMGRQIAYMRSQLADQLQGANRDYLLSGADRIAPQGFADTMNGILGYSGQGNWIVAVGEPILDGINIFMNYGVPINGTSGTYAGKAPMTNGSILLDTNRLDPKSVYINRGTTNSPLWQVFRADDGIDYIMNADALINCQCYAALMLAQQNGLLRYRPNYQQKEFQADMKKMFELAYDEAKYGKWREDGKARASEGDFSLIDFDISGDGILSDWEQEQNEQQVGIRRFFF